ncbi:hypothetical protein MAR_020999 [Mya arenaria]|uniref:Uncharacterized protein n=1 Tax=Mya arenaria TaxID=6604 RepID=A0ABY7E6G6_MYAAR|nr:hypothetical protein MAR_020999 [Mya arenaria]
MLNRKRGGEVERMRTSDYNSSPVERMLRARFDLVEIRGKRAEPCQSCYCPWYKRVKKTPSYLLGQIMTL